jgi:FHA domain
MTETGLIIAEVVFLVLLYAFVWAIVRSASRQLTGSPAPPPPPPAAPEPPPAQREPAMAAAPAAPAASEPAVAPLPPPVDIPAPPPVPAAASDRSEDMTEAADQGSGPLDLSANLDPRLVVEASPSLAEGREIPLVGGITIGRSEAADVTISDQFVVDLGSTNGTFLNDRRIESDAQLKVRDTLRIGQSILRYEE